MPRIRPPSRSAHRVDDETAQALALHRAVEHREGRAMLDGVVDAAR